MMPVFARMLAVLLLCGASSGQARLLTTADGATTTEIADDPEWPVLVPPFERDGIAIEETWSVAGLRREAVRMAHCIHDPRFADPLQSCRACGRAARSAHTSGTWRAEHYACSAAA